MKRPGLHGRAAAPWLVAAALAWCTAASAQFIDIDPDWKEDPTLAPPAYSAERLIPIALPRGSSLRMGIDPDTISIGKDGVVRYVVVLRGPAAESVTYEGIRCAKAEYRVYARRNGDEPWRQTHEDWRSMHDTSAVRYAWQLARDGVCLGRAPGNSPKAIAQALRSPRGTLYLD